MRKIAEIFREASNPTSIKEILNRDKKHDVNFGEVDLIKVWPKPGNRFVFLYKVSNNGKKEWAVAYIFDPKSDFEKRKSPKTSIQVPEWNGFIQRFPDDFRMPQLKAAAKVDQAKQHLQSHLENNGSKWAGFNIETAKLRGYWPGKRCQIEYFGSSQDGVSSNFFAKIYRENNGLNLLPIHDYLRNAGFNGKDGKNTPQPIAYCPRLHALLMEPCSGKSVSEILDSVAASEIISRSGSLIAHFHQLKFLSPNPSHLADKELMLLKGWRSVLGILFQKEPYLIKNLLGKLERLAFFARTPVVCSHRDFHENQLLFDGKVLTVLDLDTSCLAPRELDVGNFLAHITMRGIQRQLDQEKYNELEQVFTQAYRIEGGILDDRAVFWFKAAALLRLSCMHRIQPKGELYFDGLIRETENLLNYLGRNS